MAQFKEQINKVVDTKLSNLFSKDFDLKNTIKFDTSFKLANGGKFKIGNEISSSLKDDTVSYKDKIDTTVQHKLLPNCNKCDAQGQIKVKGTSIGFLADLGQKDLIGGKLNPYVGFNTSTSFDELSLKLGWIFKSDKIKNHCELKKDGSQVLFTEKNTFTHGAFSVNSHVNATYKKPFLLGYNFQGVWNDKDTEISITTGADKDGLVAPEFLNVGLWYQFCKTSQIGLNITNSLVGGFKNENVAITGQKNLGKDLKARITHDIKHNHGGSIIWKVCPQTTINANFSTNLKGPTEKGYLDYPFKFGLKVKFDN